MVNIKGNMASYCLDLTIPNILPSFPRVTVATNSLSAISSPALVEGYPVVLSEEALEKPPPS